MIGSYNLAYTAAWIVFIIGLVAGTLAGVGAGLRPSWLSQDMTATAAVVATICIGLAAALPAIGRTPSKRETNYLAAAGGALPDDLARKHPTVGIPPTG